ncbi:Methyltransferase domain protein [compost metagenome]
MRKRWGERLELVNSALQDWQTADGRQFDAVLDNGCFHHQHPDEWDAYLAHMRSHVRKGGLIALNVFGVDSSNPVPGWREMDNQRQGYFFTEQGIRDSLEGYGFAWQELVVIERQHGDAMYLLALVRN